MAVNKVVYNTANGAETLIDLTEDSVTPETLAEGVTAHDASGEVIVGTAVIAETAPDYVVTEAKRVADIVQEKRTVGSLTFTAMSDAHIEVDTTNIYGLADNIPACRDAGLGLAELQKHLKLDFAAMLGDYTWGDSAETVAQVKKDLTGVKQYMADGMRGIPNIWCTGNHDINYGASSDRRMTEDELYAYITSNNAGTIQDGDNIGRNYGYIDFDNQKIRCIYLNTADALDYPDNSGTKDDAEEITAIQAQWLADVGLNLADKTDPTEWGIVFLSHHCLSLFQRITTILTAYKDGTSGSVNITTNGTTTAVTYDFTASSRGEIICAVHGHNHNFIAKQISSEPYNAITKGWLWSIGVPNMDTKRDNEAATSSDTAWQEAFGEFDSEGNPVYYPKTQGTATSTSFCVIVIDRKNRKVHAITYGAGAVDTDREFDYSLPSFTNLIETVGYTPDTYLSSSSGNPSTKVGYGTIGFIEIPTVTSHTEGQVVVRLANVEGLVSDGNFRFGTYDENKTLIGVGKMSIGTEGYTAYKVNYWLGDDGYVNRIDFSTYLMTNAANAKYIRISAAGLDGESIITLNEEIV